MESWSYVSGEKGSVSDAAISASDDSYSRNRSAYMNCDLKAPYSFSSNMIVPVHQSIENQAFGGFGYGELSGKQLPDDSIGDVLSSKIIGERTVNPILATSMNAFPGDDDESTSKLSSSVVDSNSKDSPLIDLKLGRFLDHRDGQNSSFSVGAPILSSSESSTPPKRVRAAGISSHIAYCQVYGCNKDLSSSKDYHKRHKVCDVHSKTAKVIVNGIEQRFCQQCSRFHFLAEFDDGKRSCRKRLADHNERRRKPQVGIHSGRTKSLQYNAGAPQKNRTLSSSSVTKKLSAGSLNILHVIRFDKGVAGFTGGRFRGTMLTTTSFICQDLLPIGVLHHEKYVTNEWGKRIKVEDGTNYSPLSAIPIANEHFRLKSPYPSSGIDKLFPSFHDNGANIATGGISGENNARYPHDFGGTNSGSRPLFQDTTFGSEDINVFDAASTIQGLSGISDSGCALSLLSSQSQNSSSHSSGIPMARSLVIPGSHTHYSMSQVSEKLIGVSSQASDSGVSNKFSPSGMNSTEVSHLGALLISDGSEAANLDITDGIYGVSEFMITRDRLSCEEDGPTIDLLQLSSQLQRVERQRQSMQVKPENEAFCCLRIT